MDMCSSYLFCRSTHLDKTAQATSASLSCCAADRDEWIRPTARPSSLASSARTLARSILPRSSSQQSGADYFLRFPGCRWTIRHDAVHRQSTVAETSRRAGKRKSDAPGGVTPGQINVRDMYKKILATSANQLQATLKPRSREQPASGLRLPRYRDHPSHFFPKYSS